MNPLVLFDPLLALEAITLYDATGLTASTPQALIPGLEIEAVAQACGLHLRHLHDFRVQVFLVSLSGLTVLPLSAPRTVQVHLLSRTAIAAVYKACLEGCPPCSVTMGCRALAEPDPYFAERFQCLIHS